MIVPLKVSRSTSPRRAGVRRRSWSSPRTFHSKRSQHCSFPPLRQNLELHLGPGGPARDSPAHQCTADRRGRSERPPWSAASRRWLDGGSLCGSSRLRSGGVREGGEGLGVGVRRAVWGAHGLILAGLVACGDCHGRDGAGELWDIGQPGSRSWVAGSSSGSRLCGCAARSGVGRGFCAWSSVIR